MTKLSAVVVAVLVVGTLAGCADASAEQVAAGRGTAGPAPSASSASEGSATESEASASPAADVGAGDVDPQGCLIGTWVADNAFFLASIREFGDEVRAVDGVVTVAFAADGTTTTDYQDWTLTAVAEGEEVRLVRSGVDTGTFAATDESLTLADTRVGSTLRMTVAGMEMSIEPAPVDYTDVEYVCSASDARITTPDGTLELSRR